MSYAGMVLLVGVAGALLASGVGRSASWRVAMRGVRGAGVIAGVVLLAAAAAAIWTDAALAGARRSGRTLPPFEVSAFAFAGTVLTALLAWGFTGVIRRRIQVSTGTFSGRRAVSWSAAIIAAASFEIGAAPVAVVRDAAMTHQLHGAVAPADPEASA